MALKIVFTAWLLSNLTLAAARQQHIRRQSGYGVFSNTTSAILQASSSSSVYPDFSFDPQSITPSPVPTPSTVPVTSTHHFAPSPVGPGSRPFPTDPSTASIYPASAFSYRPRTSDCGGATLEVLNATLDWWWPETDYDPVSTLSFQHDDAGKVTGWTIIGDATSIDPSTAITTEACDPTPLTFTDSDDNSTWTALNCSYVAQTVAPATTAVTITAFKNPTSTTGTGFDDVPNYRTFPAPPEATIANATFGTDSPFVYFNAYQIVSSNYTRKKDGMATCNTITRTYNLSAPYAFSYTGPDPEAATDTLAPITGDLDPYLATALGQPSLTLGSFTAIPTVVVVIEEAFQAAAVVYAAATMFTATMLDVPTPTLPSGISASTTESNDAGGLYTSLVGSPRVEQSDHFLLVPSLSSTVPPLVVQSDLMASTKSPGPQPGKPAGVFSTTQNRGGDSSDSSQPHDALDVLTQAIGPAIMQGLGASPTPAPIPGQAIVAAGATATPTAVSGFVVSDQTAFAGGPPITAGGKVISVQSGGSSIVVDGSTVAGPAAASTITANGVQITQVSATGFMIGGQTLLPGGPAVTISNTAISLASGGGAIIIGSTTSIIQTRVITVGTQTITANAATQFVFGSGQTLTQGGAVVIRGTTVSLAPGATAVIVNGKTTTISVQGATSATAKPPLTIDGQTITAQGAGVYVISGQTLSTGGAVTFTGPSGKETVSLDNSGSVIVDVVSGKSTTSTLQQTAAPVITLAGQTFTAQSGGSTYIINGQTITAGGARTVVVGSSTYILSLAPVPTVVEIEQIGPSGQVTATSYETLYSSTATSGSTASTTSTIAKETSYTAGATPLAFEIASAAVLGAALIFTMWL